VRVGLFGQLNLDWWKVARGLDMRILTEFIGDLAKLGPEFAEGRAGPHNIFNHCTRVPQETWKLFADAGVNVTVNPRSDALFGFDDESFAYQQAIDHGLTPALGIDLDTAFGSDLFGEMHALFGQQRSAMRYRRFRGEANVPAPISVEAVLKAATVNGARAAGLESEIGTLTPGKQADIIMVRTNGVAVFPVTNAIGTIVQAVERSDVDTVMVAGEIRKRAGKLVGVDVAKLTADVTASRDYLLEASGYRPDLFGASTAAGRGLIPASPPERAATHLSTEFMEAVMSALAANGVSRRRLAPVHLSRPAPGIIAALFCGYLASACRCR
jgi:5-methylthioadenosine/S-adenosylhomocysteine deaminase